MKKQWLRLIAAVMMCALLCTSLCGCSVIDDLRAATATKPNADTVVWNGANYKRLDENLSSQMSLHGLDYMRSVYINTNEVPTLLMPFLCSEFNPTENDVFLCYYEYNDIFISDMDAFGYSYYCREDRYDDVVRQLREGLELTEFFYQFFDTENGELSTYYFSEEERAAFQDSVSPMNRWNTRVYGADWSTAVQACTVDGIMSASYYEILQKDGAYYIAYHPETTEIYVDYLLDEEYFGEYEELTEYYRVPRKYYDLFKTLLMDSVKEQAMAYEDYYEW